MAPGAAKSQTRKIVISLLFIVLMATVAKIYMFSQNEQITRPGRNGLMMEIKETPMKDDDGLIVDNHEDKLEDHQVPLVEPAKEAGEDAQRVNEGHEKQIEINAVVQSPSKQKAVVMPSTSLLHKPPSKASLSKGAKKTPMLKAKTGSKQQKLFVNSRYHVGGFELIAKPKTLSKAEKRKIANRLANYKPPQTCVFPCQGRKSVKLELPVGVSCQEPIICEFTQYAVLMVEYDRLIYQNLTRNGTCLNENVVSCKMPFSHDCFGSSWNEWNVKVTAQGASTEDHFFDLAIHRHHPFKILSIFDDPRPELLQVISYYTPNTAREDRCNALYCIYEYPDSEIERFRAVHGDVAITYCPRPTRVAKEIKLRLTYDHKLLSYPFVVQITKPETELSFEYMTMCVIVRKEGQSIEEWIEFHKMMGFSRFVIYDNNYEIDEAMNRTLQRFPEAIHRPWAHDHSQTEALNECILRYGNKTRWMTFIDADEFLTPTMQYPSIKYILETFFPNESYLHANWLTFGPCGNEPKQPNQVVMEMCTNQTISSSKFPKPTFNPNEAIGIQGYGPHFIRLRKNVDGHPKSKSVYVDEYFQIFHYRYRTWGEYVTRRKGTSAVLQQGWDDARLLKEWQIGQSLSVPLPAANNSILRFIPELKQRLHKT